MTVKHNDKFDAIFPHAHRFIMQVFKVTCIQLLSIVSYHKTYSPNLKVDIDILGRKVIILVEILLRT